MDAPSPPGDKAQTRETHRRQVRVIKVGQRREAAQSWVDAAVQHHAFALVAQNYAAAPNLRAGAEGGDLQHVVAARLRLRVMLSRALGRHRSTP
jgi:hypothetical protein